MIGVRAVCFNQRDIFADTFKVPDHYFPQRAIAIFSLILKVGVCVFEVDLTGCITAIRARAGNAHASIA